MSSPPFNRKFPSNSGSSNSVYQVNFQPSPLLRKLSIYHPHHYKCGAPKGHVPAPNTQVIDFRWRADSTWAEIPFLKLRTETGRDTQALSWWLDLFHLRAAACSQLLPWDWEAEKASVQQEGRTEWIPGAEKRQEASRMAVGIPVPGRKPPIPLYWILPLFLYH